MTTSDATMTMPLDSARGAERDATTPIAATSFASRDWISPVFVPVKKRMGIWRRWP